jgi:archaellum component FlaC
MNPVKFTQGVLTTTVFNGGLFSSGATVKIYLSPDTTFSTTGVPDTTTFTFKVTVDETNDKVVIDNSAAGYIASFAGVKLVMTRVTDLSYTSGESMSFSTKIDVRDSETNALITTVSVSGTVTVKEDSDKVKVTLSAFSFLAKISTTNVEAIDTDDQSYTPGQPTTISDSSVAYTTGADLLLATVTLEAGQTSFSNTIITLTMPSTPVDMTCYVAATDDNGASWTSYARVTITTQTPSITPSLSAYPGKTVEVTGSGFTENAPVTIYLRYPGGQVLATTTADSTGGIDVYFTVPNLARGSYKIIAQQADTLQAEGTLQVTSTVISPFSIRGKSGETFTLQLAGLLAGKTIKESTSASPQTSLTIGGVTTYHAAATTGSDGTLTVTVTLSGDISGTGPIDVVLTYTDGSSDTITGGILVSKPQDVAAPDGSQVLQVSATDRDAASGVQVFVGDSITIVVYNFPASDTVTVYFGPTSMATITTDANGAGKASTSVPALPGLDGARARAGQPINYRIRAVSSYGIVATTTDTYNIRARTVLYDFATGAKITSSTYVLNGTQVKMAVSGLRPLFSYTLTLTVGSTTYDLVKDLGAYVPSGELGSITAVGVKTDAVGRFTIVFTVKYPSGVSTGSDVSLSFNPPDISLTTPVFESVGVPSFEQSSFSTSPGSTFTLSASKITNLIPGASYQLFLDGSLLSLGGTGYANKFVASGTAGGSGSNPSLTFAAPSTTGVYKLSIRYYGGTADLATVYFLVSKPAETDKAILLTPSVKSGDSLKVAILNLATSGMTVRLYVGGSSISGATTSTDANGAGLLSWTVSNLPSGTYIVSVKYDTTYLATSPSTVTVGVKLTLDKYEGSIGEAVAVTASGLDPCTAYNIFLGDINLGVKGISDEYGVLSASLSIPTVVEGTYTLKLVRASDAVVVATADFKVKVPSTLTVTPNPSAFPGQLVTFKWGVSNLQKPVYVYIFLDDYLYKKVEVGTDTDINYVGGYIYGSFEAPNVATAGTILKLTIKYVDSASAPASGSVSTALKIVEGRGALVMGISDADVTRIANAVNSTVYSPIATVVTQTGETVKVALSDLINARTSEVLTAVKNVNGTLYAQIETKYGDMLLKLDAVNAKLDSISNGIVTINSTLGEIKASLSAIDLSALDVKIAAINDTVVKISSAIGDVEAILTGINARVIAINGTVATIKTDVGTISGKITSIDNNVATIRTDVGTVKMDVSALKSSVDDVKDTVETVPGAVGGLVAPIWAAVILSLIAAIAAIYAVVTIRRKIAG